MAFYKDYEHKTRQEKREDAFRRGGFEEEGRPYHKKNGEGRPGKPGYGQKPGYGHKSGYGKAEFGGKPGYGKPEFGGKPSYGKPDFDRKPGYGKPNFDRKPGYGKPDFDRKPGYGKPEFGGKPGYGKPEFGGKPGYGKPNFDHKPGYGKPDFDHKPGYGKPDFDRKPSYGKPDFDHKPGYGKPNFDRKPDFGKPGFDHKPSFEHKPPMDKPGFEDFRYNAPMPPMPPHYDGEEEMVPAENMLTGRNPIREALKSGRDIEKLMVARGDLSGSAREILSMARERHIVIQEVDRARLDAITKNHQGMVAFASAYAYSTMDKMLENAAEKGEKPFLILLDSITDPHNLGAIIRSAECAGAHGVIVQERRAVGLTPAAVKASAGAVEYLPVAKVTNLVATIEELKAKNIWTYAADMQGKDYGECDFTGGVALIIGAEGEGVSRLALDHCDETVSLPIKGHVDSLNASVAAGILMYAVLKGRQ